MTLFPENFVRILIYGALFWTTLGGLLLLTLLIRDYIRKNIW